MDATITNEEFRKIAIKCLDGTATTAGQEAFNNAFQLLSRRYNEWDNKLMGDEEMAEIEIYRSLAANLNKSESRKTISRIYKYAIAAAILIFTGIGICFLASQPSFETQIVQNKSDDLKPGENKATPTLANGQVAANNNKIILIKNADTEIVTAWKSGLFPHKNANIQTITRQVARWYDVDIQYEGTIPDRRFSGKMQRNLSASQVLEPLSFTKINFKIEERKL